MKGVLALLPTIILSLLAHSPCIHPARALIKICFSRIYSAKKLTGRGKTTAMQYLVFNCGRKRERENLRVGVGITLVVFARCASERASVGASFARVYKGKERNGARRGGGRKERKDMRAPAYSEYTYTLMRGIVRGVGV